jgi:hypothetical protein
MEVYPTWLWKTVCELENGPVEIVDLPSYNMVDLSIVMKQFTRPGNGWILGTMSEETSGDLHFFGAPPSNTTDFLPSIDASAWEDLAVYLGLRPKWRM